MSSKHDLQLVQAPVYKWPHELMVFFVCVVACSVVTRLSWVVSELLLL